MRFKSRVSATATAGALSLLIRELAQIELRPRTQKAPHLAQLNAGQSRRVLPALLGPLISRAIGNPSPSPSHLPTARKVVLCQGHVRSQAWERGEFPPTSIPTTAGTPGPPSLADPQQGQGPLSSVIKPYCPLGSPLGLYSQLHQAEKKQAAGGLGWGPASLAQASCPSKR